MATYVKLKQTIDKLPALDKEWLFINGSWTYQNIEETKKIIEEALTKHKEVMEEAKLKRAQEQMSRRDAEASALFNTFYDLHRAQRDKDIESKRQAVMANRKGPDSARQFGTAEVLGLLKEPEDTEVQIHAGERVLNPQETAEYNKSVPDAGQIQYMNEYNQTAKQLLEATKATNELLNKQVAIAMATEKNTKKTSKVVDKVGPSIV